MIAGLAALCARWGVRCEVARDHLHGGFAVYRAGGELPLARGETPADAVTAALELQPGIEVKPCD